ncbi:hypothetical protein ACHIPZ_13700 [Antrihabitans sp. NCIMB 15449]|uniref:Uncharacterized protein n=1 Tax=Antrihabitans spumae TaxID=3373370 RepID=A0ABW7JML1_9NOCA
MADIVNRVRRMRRQNRRWYEWGHRVMTLVGREDGGAYDGVPRPRDMWFRHENGRIRTTYNYDDVRAKNDGEWKIFDSQNDGFDVVIGYWPHPNDNGSISRSGLDGRAEQRLFLRWFVWDGLVKAEWLGLRRWLYYKALTSVVEQKVPFTCQATPTSGYSHWHCSLRRKHVGEHRFHNYTWANSGRVKFKPVRNA